MGPEIRSEEQLELARLANSRSRRGREPIRNRLFWAVGPLALRGGGHKKRAFRVIKVRSTWRPDDQDPKSIHW